MPRTLPPLYVAVVIAALILSEGRTRAVSAQPRSAAHTSSARSACVAHNPIFLTCAQVAAGRPKYAVI